MTRLFTLSIDYQGDTVWAQVVEHHHSPSIFHVTFQDHWEIDTPKNLVLYTKDDELLLAENSSHINDELLKVLTRKIKENSSNFSRK